MRREQEYVSMLYGRLDQLRDDAERQRDAALRGGDGTHQGTFQRDASSYMYAEKLARLNAVENGLCFGRLDLVDGEERYVGRIGIFEDAPEREPLLIDWRAPVARPFYLATPAAPDGVWRRRHIKTTGRNVVGLDDELLDHTATDLVAESGFVGESALLAVLAASRTGRMRDIVATIQAEQDRIIRAPSSGVLVVEGGPGTGKTVVALHRAAYLLYTYREQLARRGVLVIGPNTTFLSYVAQVLPSLGETGVVMWTVGEMFPGVSARTGEPVEVAEVKGRQEMVDVLAAAVRGRQVVPDEPVTIEAERYELTLTPDVVDAAREKARATGRLHNDAREVFADEVLDVLARHVVDRIGDDAYAGDPLGGADAPGEGVKLLDEDDVDDLHRELDADPVVQRALSSLWPRLTPQRLLTELYASRDRIASAAPMLTLDERALLQRSPTEDWTPADVPLLDEAAELLGGALHPEAEQEPADELAEEEAEYAQGVLDIAYGSRAYEVEDDEEDTGGAAAAYDLLDAGMLASRQEYREDRTIAERAAADRSWAFGHVVVDEAQELSAMAWRMVLRRCPTRSMTVVGDPAQTSDLAGTESWARSLRPHLDDRWRLERLSVNYRTSAEIMAVAADVLAELDHAAEPPKSVRETGGQPWRVATDADQLPKRLAALAAAEADAVGDGRLAVLVPAARRDELAAAVRQAVPDAEVGAEADLERTVVVLDVRQAKGLEFDSVLLADPQGVIDDSARGLRDLYMALTRPTERLGVVHRGDPPPCLADVPVRPGG